METSVEIISSAKSLYIECEEMTTFCSSYYSVFAVDQHLLTNMLILAAVHILGS